MIMAYGLPRNDADDDDNGDWEYKLGEIFPAYTLFRMNSMLRGGRSFCCCTFLLFFFSSLHWIVVRPVFPCMRLPKAKRGIVWNVALFSMGCAWLFGILFAVVAGKLAKSAILCSDMQNVRSP